MQILQAWEEVLCKLSPRREEAVTKNCWPLEKHVYWKHYVMAQHTLRQNLDMDCQPNMNCVFSKLLTSSNLRRLCRPFIQRGWALML